MSHSLIAVLPILETFYQNILLETFYHSGTQTSANLRVTVTVAKALTQEAYDKIDKVGQTNFVESFQTRKF